MSLVMDAAARRQYMLERRLHPDPMIQQEQLDNLGCVVIHNAFHAAEVEAMFEALHIQPTKYFPHKSTEAHYYVQETGNLHVVNSRGVVRGIRDEDLGTVLNEGCNRSIPLEWQHYANDPAKASKRFLDFASDLVLDVMAHVDKSQVRQQGNFYVIIGPHSSLPEVGVQFARANDFLNYKILQNGGKDIVAFDYIFADQAKNVLSQLYAALDAYFTGLAVHVFHYGKVGILNPTYNIGQICVPTAVIDEDKIMAGDTRSSPVHNQLFLDDAVRQWFADIGVAYGTTINTTTVLRQSREILMQDRQAGGDFLDMEWSVMEGLHQGANSSYPRLARINHYFAGIGSDKPLAGLTLADTAYPRGREQLVVQKFLELVKKLG